MPASASPQCRRRRWRPGRNRCSGPDLSWTLWTLTSGTMMVDTLHPARARVDVALRRTMRRGRWNESGALRRALAGGPASGGGFGCASGITPGEQPERLLARRHRHERARHLLGVAIGFRETAWRATSTSSLAQPKTRQKSGSTTRTAWMRPNGIVSWRRCSRPRSRRTPSPASLIAKSKSSLKARAMPSALTRAR